MSTLILVSNLIEAFVWIIGGIIVLCIHTEVPEVSNQSYRVSKRWLAASFISGGLSVFAALIIGKFQGGRIEVLSIYSLLFFYVGLTTILLSFVTLHNAKNLRNIDLVYLFGPTLGLILLHGGVSLIWGPARVYSFAEYLSTVGSAPALILRTLILVAVVGGTGGVIYKYFKARKAYNEMINNYFSGDDEIRHSEWIDHYFFFLIGMLFLIVASSLTASIYFDLFYGLALTGGMIYLTVRFINYQTFFNRIVPAIEYAEQTLIEPRESPDSVVGVLLQRWMARDDKPYLHNGLSLASVSQMVGIRSRKLSAHINIKYGMTFNSWINMLRIQEVERILRDRQYDNKTLSQIALHAGFADLAAMSNAFKKITGVSPSAFRRTDKS